MKTTTIEILVIIACLLFLLGALYSFFRVISDDNPSHAAVLQAQGYTEINLGESALLGCGKGDSVFTSVKFTAKGVNKMPVHGVVCCGLLFKSCTVRIEP